MGVPVLYCDAVKESDVVDSGDSASMVASKCCGVFPHMIERSAASTILRPLPTLTGTKYYQVLLVLLQ